MIHNDVLRSVRYMLDISDKKVIEIIKLGGMDVALADLVSYLDKKEEDEEGFVRCPDEVMAHFLDGLVIFKRGKDESRPPQPIEVPVTNNIILKKLRVAFELKEDDMHAILKAAGPRYPSPGWALCSATSAKPTTARAATSCCATSSRA